MSIAMTAMMRADPRWSSLVDFTVTSIRSGSGA
jgi:hypothetical protein